MFRSLAFKWTVTLLLTSLIGVVLVGLTAYRTIASQYERLRIDQAEATFIEDVTTYYQTYGKWEGLETWMWVESDPPTPTSNVLIRPWQVFVLIDLDGVVVYGGRGPFHQGDVVAANLIAEGSPVTIDGQPVAIVLPPQIPPEYTQLERDYLNGMNLALLVGAVGASAVAVMIGLLLSRQFLRPLSALTQAITAMHTGNLDQRVEIRTRDELGLLAQTFNEMSANLYRANQTRKQMTADIAHDLRTPLTVIAGYLEAMQDGTLKPTPERFRVMGEEVNLLQRLVEDLRTLSLADSGELKLMHAQTPPHELMGRVAASFAAAAAASGVQLTVDVSADVPNLWIDSERMVQVLGNLVTNALRHTPNGGSITLAARYKPDGIELTVHDTGAGIAPDDLPKVFDRFYRGSASRQTETGESGLGLAIARSIVEAHTGTITADSILGKGTTISIRLP